MTATVTAIRRIVNCTENITPPRAATISGSDTRIATSTRMFQKTRVFQLTPTSGASINPVWNGKQRRDRAPSRGPRAGGDVGGDGRKAEDLEAEKESPTACGSLSQAACTDHQRGQDRDEPQIPERRLEAEDR